MEHYRSVPKLIAIGSIKTSKVKRSPKHEKRAHVPGTVSSGPIRKQLESLKKEGGGGRQKNFF